MSAPNSSSREKQDAINRRQVERRRERRARLDAIKLAAGCADCGYNQAAIALDFDHRPGETKVDNVSWLSANYGWATVKAEIAKCDVVCANCHRIRTAQQAAHVYA